MNLRQLPRKKLPFAIMLFSSLALAGGLVWSVQSLTAKAYLPDIGYAEARYPNIANSRIDTCSLCHTSAPALNPYGSAYKSAGRNSAALAAIEPLDSDGDGWTNLQEIIALTFPGNLNDHPTAATATTLPPTATNTAVPPTSTRTPTSLPPTATNTAVPPTSTHTPTNPPPIPTNTAVPPTATNTAVPPTATSTIPPLPTTTNTVPPLPTSSNTAPPPPTATNTAPPLPTATNTAPPPATATNPAPPLPTTTNTAPPPPTATHTAPPPLPTGTPGFTATSTPVSVSTKQATPTDTDDDEKDRGSRRPTPTRRPSPIPCGYYREQDEDGHGSRITSFTGSDGDRGSLYRRCKPHDDEEPDAFNQFVTHLSDFFTNLFRSFR